METCSMYVRSIVFESWGGGGTHPKNIDKPEKKTTLPKLEI